MFEKYVEKYIRENQAPCLRNQIIDFQKKRPFEGKRILDATPIYFNTMLKERISNEQTTCCSRTFADCQESYC